MSKVFTDSNNYTQIADYLRSVTNKNLTFTPEDMVDAFNSLDDTAFVRFFDYNGECLYEYSPYEVSKLESLPDLPFHSSMYCLGWCYTLDYIKNNKPNAVIAMYAIDRTSIKIDITSEKVNQEMSICVEQSNTNSVYIDWGDNTLDNPSITDGTNKITVTHTYKSAKIYEMSLFTSDSTKYSIISMSGNLKSSVSGIILDCDVSDSVFQNCNYLNYVVCSNCVTSIGNSSFSNCNVHCVYLPSSIEYLGNSVFSNNFNLNAVMVDCNISDSAFSRCRELKDLVINNNTNLIGNNAFSNCNLSHIKCMTNNVLFGDNAFSYNPIQKINMSDNCSYGNNVFSSCFVSQFDLNKNLGNGAFCDCGMLTKVNLDVQNLQGTFKGCYNLETVNMTSNVLSIGEDTFTDCVNLMEINAYNCSQIPSVHENAFVNVDISNCDLYVSSSMYNQWVNSDWNMFNIIKL